MDISNILGNGVTQSEGRKAGRVAGEQFYVGGEGEKSLKEDIEVSNGEDTVQLSSASRQLSQIAKIIADDKAERSEKISLLKQQIARGEYNISSYEVGKALLDYIEEK